MKLTDLPPEIIYISQSYLNNEDNRYFMNTCQHYFQKFKKKSIYFSLNRVYSKEYLTSDEFRFKVLNRIEDCTKQISLNLSKSSHIVPLLQNYRIHKLVLPYNNYYCDMKDIAHSITCLHHVSEITNDLLFPKIQELIVDNADHLTDVHNFSHLTKLRITRAHFSDVTPLQNIPDLTISRCNDIHDLSPLGRGRQKKLSIIECDNLISVPTFPSLYALHVESCDNLRDVSPLYGIPCLTLLRCNKVNDISKLGNHHKLNISYCSYRLRGYDSLATVRHICLIACDISDLSVLRNAKSVELAECKSITDIKPLQNVQRLSLHEGQYSSQDFEHCPLLRHLTISHYEKEDLINFPQLSLLSLFIDLFYMEFQSYYFLKSLRHLTIKQVPCLINLINKGETHYFSHLQSLTIVHCSDLTHVYGLGEIPTIRLSECRSLVDISALGRNRCVEINSCWGLTKVASLATVPVVIIRGCPDIEDLTSLSQVPRLRIEDSPSYRY